MQTLVKLVETIPSNIIRLAISLSLTLAGGLLLIRILLLISRRTFMRKASIHSKQVIGNLIVYTGSAILIIVVLSQLGVDLTTLLGAAGIVGIAIGFASQTSVSNIISGFFLLSERPFEVGDVIKVGDKTGVILSVDLMSIKIRTFDNLFIRIPNEKVLNTEVVNVTRFPIRRLDVSIRVAYKEDVGRVKQVLLEICRDNSYALSEPEPLILFQNFGASGLEFLLGVWFSKTDFLNLKNSLMQTVKERFDMEGIEIPFPHISLYAGEATQPFPVRMVNP
jgi:small-conductance mechanosensitive channel